MDNRTKKWILIFSGFLVLINFFSLFFSKSSFMKLKSIQLPFSEILLGELEILPGLGKEKAYKIYIYKEDKGDCKSCEDLRNVYGIGEKILQKVKKFLSFFSNRNKNP